MRRAGPACDPRIRTAAGLAHLASTGREPEPELAGAELQEAKDREVRKVEKIREETAARLAKRGARP